MRLVFATNNRHKLDEVRAIVGDRVEYLLQAQCGVLCRDYEETAYYNACIDIEHCASEAHILVFVHDSRNDVDTARTSVAYETECKAQTRED